MGKFEDLSGQKFGRLTAIEICGRDKFGKILYRCRCDCGGGKSKCDFYPSIREEEKKPVTNYDLLVRKSPEELAAWISEIADCCGNDYCGKSCPLHTLCWSKSNESTLDWLKKEVKE